jgi:hypothetical protein
MVKTMQLRSLMRSLPVAMALMLLMWMAPLGAIHPLQAGTTDGDTAAILALMHETWDKPDAKLVIDPIVVEGDHAVAGWTLGVRGGRALLWTASGGWAVVLCSGDPLKEASNIAATGVPAETAAHLAEQLATAESTIPAERRAAFSRFEGTVTMDQHLKHH